ncbi:MAG: PilZ domain-containing protein [Novosphingobium sp.]
MQVQMLVGGQQTINPICAIRIDMALKSFPCHQRGGRHFNRLRLGVPASLVLTHETRSCLIDDISSTGARLRIKRPLAGRQAAELVFHELRLFASVMWLRDGECGISFDRALGPEDMQGMLWITENRELYERICQTGHAMDWAEGLRD